jgi:hypothetical protein
MAARRVPPDQRDGERRQHEPEGSKDHDRKVRNGWHEGRKQHEPDRE